MANAGLVDILDTRNQFQVKLARLLLAKSCMPNDVVEQFSSIAVLHDHVQFFLRLDDLIELDDVGVSDLLQDLYFPRNSLNIPLIVDLVLL